MFVGLVLEHDHLRVFGPEQFLLGAKKLWLA
jgi:hypothetical protein